MGAWIPRPRTPVGLVASGVALAVASSPVWWRLSSGVGAAAGAGIALGIGVGMVAFLSTLRARFTHRAVPRGWAILAFGWCGLMFVALTVTLVTEPVRWAALAAGWPADPVFAALTPLAATALAAWGYRSARHPTVTRHRVVLDGLPPTFDGLRVVQLSDLHLAEAQPVDFPAAVVAAVRALAPDLVVVTGDLVDGTVEGLADRAQALGALTAPLGVYFVTGNHDDYAGADPWVAAWSAFGWRPLRNAHVVVTRPEPGAGPGAVAGFVLAGVDDADGARMGGRGADLGAALAGRAPALPVVLLSHQPRLVEAAAAAGVALQLSGHTHGGQIWPFSWVVGWVHRPVSGWARVGQTALYVHRGTGSWGPTLRLGAPAEIAEFTLACRAPR
jgi:predicted MPP superfamily phosphohydrolase